MRAVTKPRKDDLSGGKDMGSSYPALKGRMGEMDYFVATMKLGEVVKAVGYAEDIQKWEDGIPSEVKKQRKLNMSRVREEMVPYLTINKDHFYSAITAEVERPGDPENVIHFKPLAEDKDGSIGRVEFDGSESVMALDGQHRLKSIELALKERPELSHERIAVILVPAMGFRRTQQLFSDLNRYAKQPSKTLNLLFEHREFFARVAKEVADKASTFRDRVNLETNSLGRKSRYHITLSVLYECVVTLLENKYGETESNPSKLKEAVDEVVQVYDKTITPSLPQFLEMLKGNLTPYDLRCKYIFCHSVGQQAIARAVRACQDAYPDKWRVRIERGFGKIDWRIKNPEWEGSALQGGVIYSRRENHTNTATFIKMKLGIPGLPRTELDAFAAAIREINPKRALPESVF
jgi:DNA sulfur modification protein DndB